MIAASLAILLAGLSTPPQKIGDCAVVHGRMIASNGTPSVRIWIIGTRRVLGVKEQNSLPPDIANRWKSAGYDDMFEAGLYGDFRVCALTPSEPGRMQSVKVTAVSNPVFKAR
jgi:hypothetical protein